jgi:beta-galactosidase/beta-glucuronidase
MIRLFLIVSSLFFCQQMSFSQSSAWKIAEGKIVTQWAEQVKPGAPLQEYPRPQMVRNNWQNLNGLWDYAIIAKAETKPSAYAGKILVPFAVEAALSGVGKTVGKDSLLWYKTSFAVPATMKGQNVLLHFGAVDWETEVYVNGQKVGTHRGGFDPFTFDITSALKKGSQQLEVRVWDPSSDGPQPRGKQVKRPNSIWYTSVTGIWQTVWIEGVPKTYIASTMQVPDIDKQTLNITANVENLQGADEVKISAWDGANKIAEQTSKGNTQASLAVNDPKLWSPESPFLYDLKVSVVRKGTRILPAYAEGFVSAFAIIA